jgi:hypothetical protein
VSLGQRTEMRRCGRRWATLEAAASSKRALSGKGVPVECATGCGGFHLADPEARTAPRRKAPQPDRFPAAVLAQLDDRDDCCQSCGAGGDLECHHRRLKGKGGSRRRAHSACSCNGLRLCPGCHHWAHAGDRRAAEAEGFIVSQSVAEPGSVGVMRFAAAQGGATMWPSCDGKWLETAPEAREMAAIA